MHTPDSIATPWRRLVVVPILWTCLSAGASAQPTSDTGGPELLPAVDPSVAPASFESLPEPTQRDRDEAFAAAIEEIRHSGILQTARNVGDRAADFDLKLANGTNLKLSELWAVGPVVLVYYRGSWSAICHQHLRSLQAALQDIHAADAQLVAVSPEVPAEQLLMQRQDKITFPLVSDEGNAAARQYGIVYRLAPSVIPYYRPFVDIHNSKDRPSYELPLAATYVIDTGGVIRYAFLDADYTHRAQPQEILDVLRRLKRDSGQRSTSPPLARR